MSFFDYFFEVTKQDFLAVGRLQRDLPEKAMLKIQFASGGGVINVLVEHVGDLIHRMSDGNTFGSAGFEFVKEKVKRCLQTLQHGYGFEREFEENIVTNAPYMKITTDELRKKIYAAMENYAVEHEKLPAYNRAQRLAKNAAISVGRRQFANAITALKILENHLSSVIEWERFAHEGIE